MKKTLLLFLWTSIFIILTGCISLVGPVTDTSEAVTHGFYVTSASDEQTRNLQKLCKVWGFARYTHQSFLKGTLDHDKELLDLIPIIYYAKEDDVNDILYEWFVGLEDDGYTTIVKSSAHEKPGNKRYLAETGWLYDKNYLGEELPVVLSRFYEITEYGTRQEKSYADTDYAHSGYRLLGLFRLWNMMEYYYPYRDIVDGDWNDLLLEFIPIMLKGSDKQSYELTLAAIAAKFGDAHISLNDLSYLYYQFGFYAPPVRLTKAEGQLVVSEVVDKYVNDYPLQPGDVLLKLDGVDIADVISDRKQYMSIPNDDKILLLLSPFLLRSHNDIINLTVLRGDIEYTFSVQGYIEYFHPKAEVSVSHELLDGNFGLINPSKLAQVEINNIMIEFADTDGLIVDLRQYPSDVIIYSLADYLINKRLPFAVMSSPLKGVPGVFFDDVTISSGGGYRSYDKSVVILMDETSMSHSEFTIMSLRNGANVTVMGGNSIGADGNVNYLILPGGIKMSYSSIGVYTPEGGQTQRIGLTPRYLRRTDDSGRPGRQG